jgi:hypothetical protein
MHQLSIPYLSEFWTASEVATNLVVFMNIVGALLLGLVVGYERAYHGRAAGMRTYGLVCMASAALTVIAGFPGDWYGGHTLVVLHFAFLAVETQREPVAAVHQRHRLGLHHAAQIVFLQFLRTQVVAVAQAVLGDHQRHLALFPVELIGIRDQLHAVLAIEGPRLVVGHIRQIAQFGIGEAHRRLDRRQRLRAGMGGEARRFELLAGLAAHAVQHGGGQKPGLLCIDLHCRTSNIVLPSFEMLSRMPGQRAFGIMCRLLVMHRSTRARQPSSSVSVSAKPSGVSENTRSTATRRSLDFLSSARSNA